MPDPTQKHFSAEAAMNFKSYCDELSRIYSAEGFELKLRPGATEAALGTVEGQLGIGLAEGLRGAWLYADGVDSLCPVFVRPGYLETYRFLSIEEALEEWDGLRQRSPQYEDYAQPRPRDPRVMSGWFQEGWLPFAGFGGGTLLLMQDCSPSPLGQRGQIIAFTHDPDEIDYVAPGFGELLRTSIDSIANDPEEFFIGL